MDEQLILPAEKLEPHRRGYIAPEGLSNNFQELKSVLVASGRSKYQPHLPLSVSR